MKQSGRKHIGISISINDELKAIIDKMVEITGMAQSEVIRRLLYMGISAMPIERERAIAKRLTDLREICKELIVIDDKEIHIIGEA